MLQNESPPYQTVYTLQIDFDNWILKWINKIDDEYWNILVFENFDINRKM